jgi:hypothetical protein
MAVHYQNLPLVSKTFGPQPQFSGFMKPSRFEGEVQNLEIVGDIPMEISGTFYRVMPDPQFPSFVENDPVCDRAVFRSGAWSEVASSGSMATATSAHFVSKTGMLISSGGTSAPRSSSRKEKQGEHCWVCRRPCFYRGRRQAHQ